MAVWLKGWFLFSVTVGFALAIALECPPLWTRYGGNCYRFFGPGKMWEDAEAHCQEFFTRYGQGHLASIHSSNEDNFIITYLTTSIYIKDSESGRVWIGFKDEEDNGIFTWTDGSINDYIGWGPGEPDDYLDREQCGEFQMGPLPSWLTERGWNDVICTRMYSYICKMPTTNC